MKEAETTAPSMTDSERLAFILRVMSALAEMDCYDDLWWRTDGDYAPIRLFITCNDFFYWATADCVEITPANVHLLEEAMRDVRQLDPDRKHFRSGLTTLLFCARAERMRPQGAYYKHIPKDLHPLFDAAGLERDPKEPWNSAIQEPKE